MGYTQYHKFKSVGQENLVNQFYRDVLSCIKIEGGNLLSLFLNEQNAFTDKFNENFHEYAIETDPKGSPCIDTDVERGFTKTARKRYDIAVLLTYLFDDYLSGGVLETSGDWGKDTDKIIHDLFVGYTECDVDVIILYLKKYIEIELSNIYGGNEIHDVANTVIDYINKNKLSEYEIEQAREENYDNTHPEAEDEDLAGGV